ncbi:MAG: anthranilate synthase component I [Dehalococcoidia bacterium]
MSHFYPDYEKFQELSKEYNLIPVYKEISADLETPVSAYLKTSDGPYSFLLESVEGGENLARYSFIGTNPSEVIKTGKNSTYGEVNPLDELRKKMKNIHYAPVDGLPKFHGGAVGYLSYDSIKYFEPTVPEINKSDQDLDVPESVFMLSDSLLIFDHVKHTIIIVAHAKINSDILNVYESAKNTITQLIKKLNNEVSEEEKIKNFIPLSQIKNLHNQISYDESIEDKGKSFIPNMTKEYYKDSVKKCKKAINDGELIQVVFSQRMSRYTEIKPFNLYRSLRAINPSPYMFFLHLDEFNIVGASPELLTQVIDKKMAVHPIAGTRPRGKNDKEDSKLEEDLINDEKELSEHLMLLDLGRNDVGKVCETSSVNVTQSFEIEKYSHVMHIVSHVTGKLSNDFDSYDALQSAFPAGTVSGAPKVRAMQLISELEPTKRGAYSGAVGYFSFTGNMDTAISLRTMIVKDNIAYLQAGGGIVADSNIEKEYEETINKMSAMMAAINHAELSSENS